MALAKSDIGTYKFPPPRARCVGLPRSYPKMWMRLPHSNSLMPEFKELQGIPSNKLKDQK